MIHVPLNNSTSMQHRFQRNEIEKRNLLPGDFQVQFDGAKVINVNSHHLRSGCKQLFGLTGHAANQEVGCQPFDLCDLVTEWQGKALEHSKGGM